MFFLFFIIGLLLALIGLIGIFYCIYMALKFKKANFDQEEKKKAFSNLALKNMIFLFMSSLGLISLIIGKIFS